MKAAYGSAFGKRIDDGDTGELSTRRGAGAGAQPRKEATAGGNKRVLRLSVNLADVDNFDGVLSGNLPLPPNSPQRELEEAAGSPRSSASDAGRYDAQHQDISLPGSPNMSFPFGSGGQQQSVDKLSKTGSGGSAGSGGGSFTFGGKKPGGAVGGTGGHVAAPERSFRDKMVRVVKSMETQLIKDQKRLRFVDDIYEGNNNPDFMSPLARREKSTTAATKGGTTTTAGGAGGKTEQQMELAQLRAQREASERAMIGINPVDGGIVSPPSPLDAVSGGGGGGGGRVSPTMPKAHPLNFVPSDPDEPAGGKLGRTAVAYVDDVPQVQLAMATGSKVLNLPQKSSRAALDDDVDDVWLEAVRLARLRIWIFLDDPDSSRYAYLTSCAILGLILLSSVTFCLETMHNFENDPQRVFIFFIIECVCIAAFTAEYVLKLLCAPKLIPFMISPLNLVDFISILPFYLEQAVSGGGLSGTRIFRTIRLIRVFRVLKLGGRFGKIQVVATSMMESLDMLAMMMFLLALTIVIFATLIFFAERGTYYDDYQLWSRKTDISCDSSALDGGELLLSDGKTLVPGCERTETPFKSIPDSFWWCIVTLMTVGYGDEMPVTGEGKLVACLAMLVSVLLLALPISVIGTEFTQQWMDYKKQEGVSGSKRKLAPKFVELREQLKGHLTMLDETLRKMRDTQTDIDDRVMRVRQMLQQKVKEQQALKRKALIKGKQAVAALLDNKISADDADEKRFQTEVEELIDERERLRQCAETADMMQGEDFPDMVEGCVEKYVFMSELKEDDYEMITAEIDDLHWRALQWYETQRAGGGMTAKTSGGDVGGEAQDEINSQKPAAAAAKM